MSIWASQIRIAAGTGFVLVMIAFTTSCGSNTTPRANANFSASKSAVASLNSGANVVVVLGHNSPVADGYRVALDDGTTEYYPTDSRVHRVRAPKGEEYLEFSGRNFATLYLSSKIRDTSRVTNGSLSHVNLENSPWIACPPDGCNGGGGGGDGWDLNGDDSPCWDCNGPVPGPNSDVICFQSSSCGNESGPVGYGVFRIGASGQVLAYYGVCLWNFQTGGGAYVQCGLIDAVSFGPAKDVSGAYFYSPGNSLYGAPHQELHCGNPGTSYENYVAFGAGYTPNESVVHLGWVDINGTASTSWVMPTTYETGTGITVTFSRIWLPSVFAATCNGSD